MKVLVKNLSGIGFRIEVKPEDTIADVKTTIEIVRGADVYPAARQMLVHQGKVLRDDGSTLEENNVTEESFIVVMLSQPRVPPIVQATESTAQPMRTQSADTTPATPTVPNESPLDLYLQGHCPILIGAVNTQEIDVFVFTRAQIIGLRAAAKANPQVFPYMLQELAKLDLQLRGIIQNHVADFFQFTDGSVQENAED